MSKLIQEATKVLGPVSSLNEAVLPSWNPAYGFSGTLDVHGDHLKKFWASAFSAVKSKAKKLGIDFEDQDVRNFLDSTYGRHFADQVNGEIEAGEDIDSAVKIGLSNLASDQIFKKSFVKIVKDREFFDDKS